VTAPENTLFPIPDEAVALIQAALVTVGVTVAGGLGVKEKTGVVVEVGVPMSVGVNMAVAVFTVVGVHTTMGVVVGVTVGENAFSVMSVGVPDRSVAVGRSDVAVRGAKLYDLLVQPAMAAKPTRMIPIQTSKNSFFFIISLLALLEGWTSLPPFFPAFLLGSLDSGESGVFIPE